MSVDFGACGNGPRRRDREREAPSEPADVAIRFISAVCLERARRCPRRRLSKSTNKRRLTRRFALSIHRPPKITRSQIIAVPNYDAGSPGGSPSQNNVLTNDDAGSPGGSPSQKSSPSLQITNPEMLKPGGRGVVRAGVCQTGAQCADRAGDCQHQQIKDGSPGGSPSQIGSPSLQMTRPEMSNRGGRGADRAGGYSLVT
jgi:hypothetical protein